MSSFVGSQIGLGWTDLKHHLVPAPCRGQGCHSPDQVAQVPIQAGLGRIRGRVVLNFPFWTALPFTSSSLQGAAPRKILEGMHSCLLSPYSKIWSGCSLVCWFGWFRAQLRGGCCLILGVYPWARQIQCGLLCFCLAGEGERLMELQSLQKCAISQVWGGKWLSDLQGSLKFRNQCQVAEQSHNLCSVQVICDDIPWGLCSCDVLVIPSLWAPTLLLRHLDLCSGFRIPWVKVTAACSPCAGQQGAAPVLELFLCRVRR